MAKKRRQHEEEAWRDAKRICRLNPRQIEMARALGMNPRTLPRLRPSSHERWKLPVGAFIEACYQKRFGAHPRGHERAEAQPRSLHGSSDAHVARALWTATSQVEELVCYLMNLADDFQKWLAYGKVTEVLPQVSQELRNVAKALDTGNWISAVPEIPVPSRPVRAPSSPGRIHQRPSPDEDDIPF